MSWETVLAETSPRGVLTITLNRPDKGNAINEAMRSEVTALMHAAAGDANIRVVVLRANGKHFCAGADVGAPRTAADAPGPKPPSLGEMLASIEACPKPVIAVAQGASAGAGAAIAALCDVVIAIEDAFFAIPEVRMGFAPGGIQASLMRAIGARQYRRYALSGERLSANVARRIGLAHEVCGAGEADIVAAGLVDSMLLGAPGAQGEIKRAVAAAVRGEAYTIAGGMDSPEAREGIAAFKEKRKPNWYRT